jgi:hypothetical protein
MFRHRSAIIKDYLNKEIQGQHAYVSIVSRLLND